MSIISVILTGWYGTPLATVAGLEAETGLSFGGERSLFQDTVLRCQADFLDPRPIIVDADGYCFLLVEDLIEIGVAADIISLERAAAIPGQPS